MTLLAALLLFLQADYSADGMKALQANNLEAAAEAFTKAIAQDPKDFGAHFNLALTYSLSKQDAKAIPEYQKTLELKPGLYQAQLNLGILLLRDQRAADAVEQLKAAVAQKPNELQPNFNLAAAYLASGQPALAEKSYLASLAINAGNPAAELGLGRAQLALDRLEDAAPHFQKAAELDPKYHDALLELATAYEGAKQTDPAIAIYQQFPGNAAAQKRLGELLMESQRFADAIPRLEKAVADSPTAANRLALATAYRMTKQPDKELDQLSKASTSAPRDYDLRMIYGRCLRDQRKLVPASEQFLAAAQIKPDSVEAWNELASALINSENYVQGLAALDRIRALGKETPGDLFFRAITLDKLHQLKPALAAYEQFLAADNGGHPDQEFQARQRARIIERELTKR
jgi:tetratricopeptide (TPR) repeat protein